MAIVASSMLEAIASLPFSSSSSKREVAIRSIVTVGRATVDCDFCESFFSEADDCFCIADKYIVLTSSGSSHVVVFVLVFK